MADTKISALTASTTPLAGTEVLPIVQSGTTKQVSVANLTAGRAVSASSVTATTGNFIVGTSGQGIDFSATPGTGTSELLADYEEGTWTPVAKGTTSDGTGTYTRQAGRYTKVGNLVTVSCQLAWSAHTGTGNFFISGLPFVSNASVRSSGAVYADGMNFGTLASQLAPFVDLADDNISFRGMINNANAVAVPLDTAVDNFFLTATYSV